MDITLPALTAEDLAVLASSPAQHDGAGKMAVARKGRAHRPDLSFTRHFGLTQ